MLWAHRYTPTQHVRTRHRDTRRRRCRSTCRCRCRHTGSCPCRRRRRRHAASHRIGTRGVRSPSWSAFQQRHARALCARRANDRPCSIARVPFLPRVGFTLINGNIVAKALRAEMKGEVDAMRASLGPDVSGTEGLPTLAVVLVGLRKDSQMYVHMKTKACAEVGVNASQYDLPAETSQEALLELIAKLNADSHTNGILVQLPLPDHIDADTILSAIDPAKDVDGLTAANAGDLLRNGHKARLIPCTPLGCIALLDHYKFEIAGKHAVVVGRSALVGKPVAQLLLSRDATVTMCHSKTKNLEELVRQADIVVAAIGRASTLKGHWFKSGAVVLDVGTNAVDDPTKRAGYRLVGDVEFEAAKMSGNVKALTPVPGGVGPMTVTMLLRNTIRAFEQQKADKEKKQAQAAAKAADKQ